MIYPQKQHNEVFKHLNVYKPETIKASLKEEFIKAKNIDLQLKIRIKTKKTRQKVNRRILDKSIEQRLETI